MRGNRSVLLPLVVAFFVWWAGTIDIGKAVKNRGPVQAAKAKDKL